MSQTAKSPTSDFVRYMQDEHVPNISRCFQCRKCTNGCPLTPEMDIMPNQAIRMVQLGMKQPLLNSQTIWVCASCQTCTTRCPNDIDIAQVMDALRQVAQAEGVPAAVEQVPKLHQSFLHSIEMFGRVFELGMTGEYKLRSKDFFSDLGLGMNMFKKGKLGFVPHVIKGRKEVKEIFKKARGGR